MLVDEPGVARSHREAPEIDGVINVPAELQRGTFHTVEIVAALGPDLDAASEVARWSDTRCRVDEFNASARLTPANAHHAGRILLAPVLFAADLRAEDTRGIVAGLHARVRAGVTDHFDGQLARRHGTTRRERSSIRWPTRSLVLGAMVVAGHRRPFWWLPVAIIAAREVAISVYRARCGSQGMAIPARGSPSTRRSCRASRRWFAV